MADYSAQIATAKRLIRLMGRQVTLELLSAGPADAAKPWRGPAAEDLVASSVQVYAAAVPPSGAAALGLSAKSNDMVKDLEQILIAEPGEDDPENLETYHRVLEGDVVWRILFVEKLRPAEQTILYFVGIGR